MNERCDKTEEDCIDYNYIVRVTDLMAVLFEESLPIIAVVTEMMGNVCCR